MSAGELTPAYIRELGRNWIVGQKSYGKGIAQVGYELPGGKNLTVWATISRTEFNDGSSLHVYGLTPDFTANSPLKDHDGEKRASRIIDEHGWAFATAKRPPASPRGRSLQKIRIGNCLRSGMSDRLQVEGPAANWLLDQQLRLATSVALCELAEVARK